MGAGLAVAYGESGAPVRGATTTAGERGVGAAAAAGFRGEEIVGDVRTGACFGAGALGDGAGAWAGTCS